jgi:ActR/RegA family two-component response regulator
VTANGATVLIVDRDSGRARTLARQVETAGSTAIVTRHLADALVQVAITEPDLAIVALGTWPGTQTSLTALRAVAPEIEIVFTGTFCSDDDTIAPVLDDGALYMPTISSMCVEALVRRRMAERTREDW